MKDENKEYNNSNTKHSIKVHGSLLDNNPELCKEWDYSKNDSPAMYSVGSQYKVWWICEKGHNWQASISNRNKGRGCPICANRIVCKGVNDLESQHPELMKEWNYEKNIEISPDSILYTTHKKAWWKCEKGHEWLASVSQRTMKKTGCRECSKGLSNKRYIEKRIKSEGSLLDNFPELCKEWNYEKNDSPTNYIAGSQKKVWWKCKKGHEWQTSIVSRTRLNTGCPKCSVHSTSFPEQAVLFYLGNVIGRDKVVSRDRTFGVELDIYSASAKIAVEYDGVLFHSKDKQIEKDTQKNELCNKKNIKLYRIREEGCPELPFCNNVKSFTYTYNDEETLSKIIKIICKELGADIEIDISRDRVKILQNYYKVEEAKSVSAVYPKLAEMWNFERNGELRPNMVAAQTGKKVWWICPLKHEWEASPNSMVQAGKERGCPYCDGNKLLSGFNDLETRNPALAQEWNYEKNGQLLPNMITAANSRKVWWIGKCGHEWQAAVSSRTKGIGCPICSGRDVETGVNDLKTLRPDIAIEWNYEKNRGYGPEDFKCGSEKKVWWKCKDCGFEWQSMIFNRTIHKNKCPKCNKTLVRKVRNIDTGEVFDNLSDAANKYSINKSNLCNCCNKKTKSAAGYHWEYVE